MMNLKNVDKDMLGVIALDNLRKVYEENVRMLLLANEAATDARDDDNTRPSPNTAKRTKKAKSSKKKRISHVPCTSSDEDFVPTLNTAVNTASTAVSPSATVTRTSLESARMGDTGTLLSTKSGVDSCPSTMTNIRLDGSLSSSEAHDTHNLAPSHSTKILLLDVSSAPAPSNLGASNRKDSATQPTGSKRYPTPWESTALLDIFHLKTFRFNRFIPIPEHRSPPGKRLITSPEHFTIFIARIGKWLLGCANNKYAVDIPHLLSLAEKWFDNVTVISKHMNHNGDVTTKKALTDVEKYGSALVILADTHGTRLIKKMNGTDIPDHICSKLNDTPCLDIDIGELRKRFNASLPNGYSDASKHFYAVLANITSTIFPTYVVLKKSKYSPILYRARILEKYSISPSLQGYDCLRQSTAQWSSDTADTAFDSFITDIAHNGYNKHASVWSYKISGDIRDIRIDRSRALALTADHIKAEAIPPLLLNKSKNTP